jgi:N-acyl amino acid synthase of PEP-CTERM/exosortase system
MFDRRYKAFLADTEQSKKIHHQLRHQVYCLEKGFEEASQFKGGMEIDDFDQQAVHFIVQDQQTSEWVATLRIVLPEAQKLPITELFKSDLSFDMAANCHGVAEISRLSILSAHRHSKTFVSDHSYPEILFGLIRAAKEYCEIKGIDQWLFLCRRSLKKIAARGGMEMKEIGKPINHRGARYPYLVDLEKSFSGVEGVSPVAYSLLNREQTFLRYSEHHSA